MKSDFDHELHAARTLLFAGWATTVFFILCFCLLALWIAGSFVPIPDSLVNLEIRLIAYSSVILVVSAAINLLARIVTSILIKIKIRPFSWFIWPLFMVFGGSCLFLSQLIRHFSGGF